MENTMYQAADARRNTGSGERTRESILHTKIRRPLFLILAILVLLIPLLGNSYSPTISSILIAVFPAALQLLFVGLTLSVIKKDGVPYRLPQYAIISVILWVALSSWSTVTGGHFMSAIVEQAEWLLLMLFAVSAAYYFFLFPADRQKIIHLIGIGYAGYFLFLLVFIKLVPDPDNYSWVSGLPGFSNIRHFGYYAAIVLAISYHGFLKKGVPWRSLQNQFMLFLLFIGWTAIIWAGGRGPFLALGMTFFILIGLRLLAEWRQILIVTMLIVPFAALLAEIIQVPDPSFGLGHLIGTVDMIMMDGDVNSYSSGRLDFWQQAIGAISEAPFFGHGPGMYSFVVKEPYSLYQHPHNGILQFLLAWGLFGGTVAFLVAGFILRAGFSRLRLASEREKPIIMAGLAGILTIVCFSLVDGTLFHTLPLTFFAIFCGLALLPGETNSPRRVSITKSPFFFASGAILIFVAGSMILNALSVFSLYRPSVPGPASWRADMVQLFPASLRYYPGAITYGRWVDRWIEESEPDVEEKILWAMNKSPGSWVDSLMEARLAEVRGEPDRAITVLEPLILNSHPVIQQDAHAILARICGKFGVCPDPAQF